MKNFAAEKNYSHLPAHLQATLNAHYAKAASFGLDTDWAATAKKNADKRGDDFNPIHGLVG